MNAEMSSHVAIITKERHAGVRRTQMDFWDGMQHTFMMPSITAKGTGIHSHRRNLVMTDSRSVAWARLSTAAISGVSPFGAGDGDDSLHLPPHHGSGVVGGLRAGGHRAGPDFPFLSRANSSLGRGGWLHPTTAPAVPGGSTCVLLVSPEGWGIPVSLGHGLQFSELPLLRKLLPKRPPMDNNAPGKGGITCGRWYCTTGLILVTGDPWMP